jgi:hypothetical protein
MYHIEIFKYYSIILDNLVDLTHFGKQSTCQPTGHRLHFANFFSVSVASSSFLQLLHVCEGQRNVSTFSSTNSA